MTTSETKYLDMAEYFVAWGNFSTGKAKMAKDGAFVFEFTPWRHEINSKFLILSSGSIEGSCS
jgi:hypothetical protein